jgi:hypothetical protein
MLRGPMSLIDLFDMARQNAAQLADTCATQTNVVRAFAEYIVKESKLSVTMKSARLQAFLAGGRYLNPWEECQRNVGEDDAAVAQEMAKRQGEWYGRRARFDGSFVDGKKFRYGVLYVTGRALVDSKYGPFCTVFRFDAVVSWKSIAWLPGNSLEWYVPDEHTLHLDKLRGDVGTHSSRHHVAAIKHCNDVAGWPREDWSTRFCNNAQFIEGIVVDDMLVKHIERVLVDRNTWRDMLKANAKCLAGIGAAEHLAKATHYKTFKQLLTATNLLESLEQV